MEVSVPPGRLAEYRLAVFVDPLHRLGFESGTLRPQAACSGALAAANTARDGLHRMRVHRRELPGPYLLPGLDSFSIHRRLLPSKKPIVAMEVKVVIRATLTVPIRSKDMPFYSRYPSRLKGCLDDAVVAA